MTHSGGMPHTNVGDRGQRFEISFYDPSIDDRRVLGWASTIEAAQRMAEAIEAHPTWAYAQILDRAAALGSRHD